jgi:hypothetical protein
MSADPRYAAVNALHAQGYPPITREQAVRAQRALIRRFGRPADASAVRTEPMPLPRGARRCWVSLKPTRGNDRGWGRLIHDVGHAVHTYRHPGNRPHATGEHVIETEIAHYVRASTDWLTVQPAAKPHRLSRITQANARDAAALERWQRKELRAKNAIRKISRRMRARLARVNTLSTHEGTAS